LRSSRFADGKRALFGARGDVFTVPAGDGVTRNLTRSPGAHERSPKWSPDGKSVAFISDATGEDEIHVGPADGSARRETRHRGMPTPYKYELVWSPDSKKIMWADKTTPAPVRGRGDEEGHAGQPGEGVGDSRVRLVAGLEVDRVRPARSGLAEQGSLYSLESGKATEVTDGWYTSGSPVFSADGKHLFFVSARDFNPI